MYIYIYILHTRRRRSLWNNRETTTTTAAGRGKIFNRIPEPGEQKIGRRSARQQRIYLYTVCYTDAVNGERRDDRAKINTSKTMEQHRILQLVQLLVAHACVRVECYTRVRGGEDLSLSHALPASRSLIIILYTPCTISTRIYGTRWAAQVGTERGSISYIICILLYYISHTSVGNAGAAAAGLERDERNGVNEIIIIRIYLYI